MIDVQKDGKSYSLRLSHREVDPHADTERQFNTYRESSLQGGFFVVHNSRKKGLRQAILEV